MLKDENLSERKSVVVAITVTDVDDGGMPEAPIERMMNLPARVETALPMLMQSDSPQPSEASSLNSTYSDEYGVLTESPEELEELDESEEQD
jgi:hypothetical protein